jgi:hypothetical protein
MKLIWFVFIVTISFNIWAFVMITASAPMDWYYQLTVGSFLGLMNALVIFWLMNGGKFSK